MTIKKWNEIEEVFTSKFGWNEGIDYLVNTARDVLKSRSVYELSGKEDYLLIKKLRTKYDKELKCLEKEKAKWQK
tara:strand:+ start:4499 stop:4723 length:225 start_codon:yes stop_codon:yes gene_type:complete